MPRSNCKITFGWRRFLELLNYEKTKDIWYSSFATFDDKTCLCYAIMSKLKKSLRGVRASAWHQRTKSDSTSKLEGFKKVTPNFFSTDKFVMQRTVFVKKGFLLSQITVLENNLNTTSAIVFGNLHFKFSSKKVFMYECLKMSTKWNWSLIQFTWYFQRSLFLPL